MFPPGLEPGTFRVLGERDNHYTTETWILELLYFFIYQNIPSCIWLSDTKTGFPDESLESVDSQTIKSANFLNFEKKNRPAISEVLIRQIKRARQVL